MMQLFSTNNRQNKASLKEAVLKSLAQDKGLYMPEVIPVLPKDVIENISMLDFQSLSYAVCSCLFQGSIPENDLKAIIQKSINFPAPVQMLSSQVGSLELWHGPSLAFKDFGARFMAGLMSYFNQGNSKKLTILVATSGDTGGAVAFGFLGLPGVEVIILYPKGKVSPLQEKQLTTLGQNISAVEVEGNFDDCQALVKEAFLDEELNKLYNLSSANSINIARLIPQSFYYFEAYKQLLHYGDKVVFSVPSGNFGNLTAGLLAKRMGLPIYHFIAATNINHVVPSYLENGSFDPKPSIPTISNAMDVGNPSNFVRMTNLFENDWHAIKNEISGYWFDDETTRKEIKYIYNMYGYVSEPHGAIGHLALRNYLETNTDAVGAFLSTAHPAKFDEVVNEVLQTEIQIPDRLAVLASRQKEAYLCSKSYNVFKNYLLQRVS